MNDQPVDKPRQPKNELEKGIDDLAIARLWARMTQIFGHRWTTNQGVSTIASGELSDTAKVWQMGLSSMTLAQTAEGFNRLLKVPSKWPPSLPEFIALCSNLPTGATNPMAYRKPPRRLLAPRSNPKIANENIEKMREILRR